MKKIKLSDKQLLKIAKVIATISTLWLLYITFSDIGITDRLNECLKNHDRNYCNERVD